jgi:hypothetical protein
MTAATNHKDWLTKAEAFRNEANAILGTHEGAKKSRVIQLEETYDKLSLLNIKQDDLFKQALRCAENELYRAAHVMAWAACEDFIEEKISEDGLIKLRAARAAWKGADIREMAEYVPERQFVDVMQVLGLTTKNETAAFVSLLQKRNECAHPTGYYPDLNQTLGYMSEILMRLKKLAKKKL